MLSLNPVLNPVLVLLVIALAMYLLTILTRNISPPENQPKKLQHLNGTAASTEQSGIVHAGPAPEDTERDQAGTSDESLHALSEQNIVIDADRASEIRAIEPDLAAALDQADAEIRLAEDQAVSASVTGDSLEDSNHPLNSSVAVLEPREEQPVENIKDATYGPDVSISDAVIVEPVPQSSPTPIVQPDDPEPLASELKLQDKKEMEIQESSANDSTAQEESDTDSQILNAAPATTQAPPPGSSTAAATDTLADAFGVSAPRASTNASTSDSTDESALAEVAPSDVTSLQVESNSAQLMLIDSFTDILIGTENLSQSMQRIARQSSVNRLARSKINAEQQRKLILANARAEKQRNDIDAEKKARGAGEKLIGKQQSEIERIRAQMNNMKQTLLLKQTEIEKQQLQLARSKSMARSAAKLARRAAITQQQAKDAAETEKRLRHKVEGRTQQAISIAKNAITALAEEEKKNRVDSAVN